MRPGASGIILADEAHAYRVRVAAGDCVVIIGFEQLKAYLHRRPEEACHP
jgi:hypothetical protein